MAVGDAYVFPSFLTPVLTQISFQSHRLLFSHTSAAKVEKRYGKNGAKGETGRITSNHVKKDKIVMIMIYHITTLVTHVI